jgi:hypothetical protein
MDMATRMLALKGHGQPWEIGFTLDYLFVAEGSTSAANNSSIHTLLLLTLLVVPRWSIQSYWKGSNTDHQAYTDSHLWTIRKPVYCVRPASPFSRVWRRLACKKTDVRSPEPRRLLWFLIPRYV